MIVAFIKQITLESGYTAECWALEMKAGKLNNEGQSIDLLAPRSIPFEITLFKDVQTFAQGGKKIENPSFIRELLEKDTDGNEIAPVLFGSVPLTLKEIDEAGTLDIFANRIKELVPYFNNAVSFETDLT